ncbi:MAG: ankrd39 [Gammaproteobacteria bacterium]|jgi:ankyrin repeat protein|nr:ankrd39 [Gammaproteobacteria bacterium]
MQAARTLLDAAKDGDANEICRLIKNGANPNVLSQYNVPALYYAVRSGHKEAAWVLFQHTDRQLLNNKNAFFNDTVLRLAAFNGWGKFIKALLKAGANANILDQYNVPALDWTVRIRHHKDAALILLQYTNPDLLNNINTSLGNTVMDIAAYRGWNDFIKVANEIRWGATLKDRVAKGLDPYAKNEEGQSCIDIINSLSIYSSAQKQALTAQVITEHAWAKRSALLMLRYANNEFFPRGGAASDHDV